MNLPGISYQLFYNQKDITHDISEQILSIEYKDIVKGASDTLDITIEDTDLRFQNEWYPLKGDKISLLLRNKNQQMDCGSFQIDELSCNSSNNGDIFTMKGLAAGMKKKMRTKKSYAHEDKSLREIANTVASALDLTIIGTVPAITFHRAHQFRETDLQFLNRLGGEYGCIFSVRGENLIFTYYRDIEGRSPSIIITKQDLISYDLKDQTQKTFKKCKVKHFDPFSGETQEGTANYNDDQEEGEGDQDNNESEDDLEDRSRIETKQQGNAKAKHLLFKNNTQGIGGDLTMPGNLLLVAGNNFQLNGAGKFSGIYHILESTHTLGRESGYATSVNIKRVKTIDAKYFKTK